MKMADQIGLNFVPNVIQRILSYTHPADQMLCKISHWQFGSAACQELHYRLASPKNGMLLLKWPLCFHNSEDVKLYDQYSYIELLRANVFASENFVDKGIRTIEQVQIFLRCYQAMMLNEILYSLDCYDNLRTLVVDLGAKDLHLPDSDVSRPFKTTTHYRHGELRLLIDTQEWAKTVAAVMDECAATLLHLVFNNNAAATASEWPSWFFASTGFDEKLACMQNLQTLYLPNLGQYEQWVSRVPDSTRAWEPLHRLTAAARLPNIKRVVLWSSDDLFDRVEHNHVEHSDILYPPPILALPVIGNRGVSVEIDDVGNLPLAQLLHVTTVFPGAEITTKSFQKRAFYIRLRVNAIPLSEVNFTLAQASPCVEAYPNRKIFVEKLAEVVETNAKIRFESLSAWNCVHAERRMVMPPKVEINVGVDSGVSVLATFTSLLSGTRSFAGVMGLLVRPRVVLSFDVSRNYGSFIYKTLSEILPLFDAVNRPDIALPSHTVKNITIRIVLSVCDPFISHVENLKVLPGFSRGNFENFVQQQTSPLFELPAVEFQLRYDIVMADYFGGIEPSCIELADDIEFEIMKRMEQLVNEAVDSCYSVRQCTKFKMYQKLERLEYSFRLRPSSKFLADALEAADGKKRRKLLRILASRQKELRRRVWNELFAQVTFGADLDREQSAVGADKVLPLPSLKYFEIKKLDFEQVW